MGRNWREKLVFFVAGQERERDLYNSVQIFGRFKLIYYDYCCWICLLAAIFSHSTSFQLRRNMLPNVLNPIMSIKQNVAKNSNGKLSSFFLLRFFHNFFLHNFWSNWINACTRWFSYRNHLCRIYMLLKYQNHCKFSFK